jgi:hypothetical protein
MLLPVAALTTLTANKDKNVWIFTKDYKMALKHTDNKHNRGWRKFVDKNFGHDEKGHGFVANLFNNYVSKHTIVQPREMDGSPPAIICTLLGTTVTSVGAMMFTILGGIGYSINYDAVIEGQNTAFVSTEILQDTDDESGVLLTYSPEHGNLMLRRAGDFYQIYQGRSVHGNDMAYRLITDAEQAAEMTSDVVTEVSASMDYPEIVGFNGVTYNFDAISHYYSVDSEDGLFRAVDERGTPEHSEVWTQENLRTLFTEATDYFETSGNFLVAYVPDSYDAHILEGPMETPEKFLEILLAGFALYAGGAAVYSFVQANTASRRRHRKEDNTFKP